LKEGRPRRRKGGVSRLAGKDRSNLSCRNYERERGRKKKNTNRLRKKGPIRYKEKGKHFQRGMENNLNVWLGVRRQNYRNKRIHAIDKKKGGEETASHLSEEDVERGRRPTRE